MIWAQDEETLLSAKEGAFMVLGACGYAEGGTRTTLFTVRVNFGDKSITDASSEIARRISGDDDASYCIITTDIVIVIWKRHE